MDQPGSVGLQELFTRLVANNRESAQLSRSLAQQAFDLFEANIGPLTRHLPKLACDKGCPSCCVLRVAATAPEILLLADYVRRIEASPQGATVGLKRRIALADRLTRGLDEGERMALRKPCPFIVRGVCLIHPVRPLACRGHASFDRKACARATAGQDVEVPLSEPHHALRAAVQSALQSALRAAGLPHELYELNHGLMLLLDAKADDVALSGAADCLAPAALAADRP